MNLERCSGMTQGARASMSSGSTVRAPAGSARSNRRICGGLRFCSTPTRSGKRGGPEQRAIAGPRAFNGLCDDEAMPLICPTSQVLAQRVRPGNCLVLCMGLFSIFCLGSHRDAAWLRESCLKPHVAGETFAVAEGFAVSITAPSAHPYLADQFNLLLTGKRLNPQGLADDG